MRRQYATKNKMSNQLTLSGQTTEQKTQEERDDWTLKFYQEECLRLKIIKQVVEKGEGKFEVDGAEIIFKKGKPILTDDWEKKKFLGEWWYCNAIKGWNNNTPQEEDLYVGNDYDGVPDCDMMANSIRGCFISVDRDGINWDKKYCLERLTMAIKCYLKKIKEFGKTEEKSFKENVESIKEVEKVENLCIVCKKKEKSWSCVDEVKNMCDDCKDKHYEEVFKELDLPNGFKDLGESYKFYSFTTGEEEVRKDRILAVLEKDRIQTCDEFGCFSNCYGITEEFANELIKKIKLVEREEKGRWENPKIQQDETSKKIAELKKELSVQKKEMMEKLKEIRGLEDGKKEKKK